MFDQCKMDRLRGEEVQKLLVGAAYRDIQVYRVASRVCELQGNISVMWSRV